MFKAEFDNHPLWATLDGIDELLKSVLEAGDPGELPLIERIRVQSGYVRSFEKIAETRVAFFHSKMLDDVREVWSQVAATLQDRVNSGVVQPDLVGSAANFAESGLNHMGPWPRAYGKGGEVSQLKAVYAELLSAQAASMQALAKRHSGLDEQVADVQTKIDEKRDAAFERFAELERQLETLETQITEDKSSIETALQDGQSTIEGLVSLNDTNFQEWKSQREKSFAADFAPFRDQVSEILEDAKGMLKDLEVTKSEYKLLVSGRAGDEIAARFEKESRFGRIWGIGLYIFGALLIVSAALPLVLLLIDQSADSSTEVSWNRILIRGAIGVLAGSAAAVLIRLGGRFVNSANQSKRMELELKAIGPFLANVKDNTQVDKAKIDLIGRSFGKTYGIANQGKSASEGSSRDDEVDALDVAAQALKLNEELVKRLPASSE